MAVNGTVSNNIHRILSISFGRPFHNMIPTNSHRNELLSEPFCNCVNTKTGNLDCVCGEEDTDFDWVWDVNSKSLATLLSGDCREVIFHQDHSCGTAAVRGNVLLGDNRQHYWEIKMVTPAYGTDMMIGVGTPAAKLDKYRYSFCSLIGSDEESWGLSYNGNLYHNGKPKKYSTKFGQGSIIGVHYDAWNGTLTFYKNRQSLGVAYDNLQGKTLYPIVSSTAARSGMKVIRSRSFETSLQYLSLCSLKNIVPSNKSVIDAFKLPPGLAARLRKDADWLAGTANYQEKKLNGFKRAYSDECVMCIKRKRYHQEGSKKDSSDL